MDPNFPGLASLDEHESLVVFAHGFRVPRSYPDQCNVPTREFDRFNCSLNLPCHAAPQLRQRGHRFTVVGVSCAGKSLDERPDGLLGSLRNLGMACRCRGDCKKDSRKKSACTTQSSYAGIGYVERRPGPQVRIPLRAISDSGGKPITIPGGNRSGVGAKRRWHLDGAKTDRNRQAELVRSEAKAGYHKQRKRRGERGGSPCPRLSPQWPGARRALRFGSNLLPDQSEAVL
jgi:hypothetical protein